MLILSRAVGQEILIGTNVRVTALAIHGKSVRLGIDAPRHVPIDRQETRLRKQAESQARAGAAGQTNPARSKSRGESTDA